MPGDSTPPPVDVDGDDPQMAAAIEQARATVDGFIEALADPQPNQRAFSVKVAITDSDQTEHLWLVPVRFEDGHFIGRINNEPRAVSTVKFGDEVRVAKDQISDWVFAEDRNMKGGFTVRVLRGRHDAQSRPAGKHELLGTWSIVSIDNGDGSEPRAGLQLAITEAEITFLAPSGATKMMGQIHRIDPKASPSEIDLRNGSSVGHGIYALDGDSLKLRVSDPGVERPTELQGSRDAMLFSLQRE